MGGGTALAFAVIEKNHGGLAGIHIGYSPVAKQSVAADETRG